MSENAICPPAKNVICSGTLAKPKDLTMKQFEILKFISDGGTAKSISKLKGVSQPCVSRILKVLEAKEYLKIDRSHGKLYTYNISSKGGQAVANLDMSNSKVRENTYRLHALQVRIDIPFNWLARWEQYLNTSFTIKSWEPVSLKNNSQRRFFLDEIRVITTTRSVLFSPADIYAPTVDECYDILARKIDETVPKIEKALSFQLIKPGLNNVRITRQEIAKMNDPVAKSYADKKKFVVIKVGKDRRMVFDFSKKIPEAEAVHTRYAHDDMKQIEDFENSLPKPEEFYSDLIQGKFDHRLIIESQERLWNNLVAQSDMVTRYGQEIMTHTDFLRSATSTIRLLQREVRKLRSENSKLQPAKSQRRLMDFTAG